MPSPDPPAMGHPHALQTDPSSETDSRFGRPPEPLLSDAAASEQPSLTRGSDFAG